MKRLILAQLLALAAAFPVAFAQNVTPPYPDTQTSSQNNPPPDEYPPLDECQKCKGNSGDGGSSSASADTASKTCDMEEGNDSVRYTLGIGSTTYQSKNNFVGRDLGKRKPLFAHYNPPSTDVPPFATSLSSEWERKLTRPVTLGIATDEITDATFTPTVIELRGGNAGNAWVKRDSSGTLRQILTDQYLTDITVPSGGGVLITSYLRSTIGALDSGTGLYSIPGNARKFRSALISRPIPTGLDTVDIVTTDYSSSEIMPKIRGARWFKSGSGATASWTLTHHTGAPTILNLYASNELVRQDLGNGLIQRTRTIRKANSNGGLVIESITREKYRDLGNGTLRIVERVDAPATPEELTTTYTYTDITGTTTVGVNGNIGTATAGASINLLTGARLHTLERSDGYWEEYKYQYNGGTRMMLTEKWSTWKNSTINDKANSRYTTITLEENARTVIGKTAGQIVSNVYEKLTLAADGTRTLREERQTGSGTPLITEHAYFSDTIAEPNKGRIQYTRHPDGTLTRYIYQTVAGGLKTTVQNGAVDATQFAPAATGPVPALTMGTRSEAITNSFEKVIDSKIYDIASGLLLEQSTAVTVDPVGRPTHIIYDADTADYETFSFACCGVKTHRARDGTLTDFTKDALERPTITIVTLGSKTTTTGYTYTTETLGGRTLPKTSVTQSITAGSNSTGSLLVSETIHDLRSQTLVSRSPDTNGDNTPETTTYTYEVATRTHSMTGSDGITNTSTSHADGQSSTTVSTSGTTPVTPLTTYDYAPHNTNGGGIKTTVQLSAGTVALKTDSSFSDLTGRTFRSESPGYNGATLVTLTTFDERGRSTGQTSTGRPATNSVLNILGEVTESWTDANGDGQFNNTAASGIKDSVTKSATDFVTEDGNICRRTRQWVRDDSDADILAATTFASADGLYQKSVPLAGTGPVTVATASKPLDGNSTSETHTHLGSDLQSPSLLSSVSATLGADGTTTTVSQNKDSTGATIVTATQISDLQGRTVSVSDGRTPATTYATFTASGTPLKTTHSDGTYTITTLDAATRPVTVETYDVANAIIASVHTSYHPSGQVAASYGTNTNPTYRLYDIQGRPTELRTYRSANLALAPDAGTTGYDATTWIYEPATGLLTRKQYPDTKGPDYTYTPDGKLLTRTWGRSPVAQPNTRITTTYGYTLSGQLISTAYSDTTPGVTTAFDRLGRQQSVTQANQSQSAFTYNPATLALATETIRYDLDHNGTYEFTRVLDRSRDTLGRDTGFQLLNGTTVENQAAYGYSPTNGRLSTVIGGGDVSSPQTFTYHYTPNSSLIGKVTGPVHDVTNTWEPTRNVLASKQNKAGTTVISQYAYSVNPLGQRTDLTTAFDLGSGLSANPGDTAWSYDALGQVISADAPGTAADSGYLFDTIGNRRGTRNGAVGVPTETDGTITTGQGTALYSANQLNQYETIPQARASPVFDDDGNMKTGPLPAAPTSNSTLDWDAENRLIQTQVGTSGSLVQTLYDAQSRRIAETVGTTTTLFVYDAFNCIAEYSFSTEGGMGVPPVLSKSRLWGIDLSGTLQGAGGVGGLLSETQTTSNPITSSSYFPAFDGNGNVSEYLTTAGAVAAHFEYDPFGNTVVNTDTSNQFSYRFSTKPLNFATGLYYYTYRYYDPLTGRWPSRDPIEEEGGINLYGFVRNDGVNLWDLHGLDTYLARRKLGGGPAKEIGKLFAHQFAFVVDSKSGEITTYSWGNSETKENSGSNRWFSNMPEDIAAAKEALAKGLAVRQGGPDLDKCMPHAFAELADETKKTDSDHFNWGVTSNCKTESCKLIETAKSTLNKTK